MTNLLTWLRRKAKDASGHEHASDGRFGETAGSHETKPTDKPAAKPERPADITTVNDLHVKADAGTQSWLAKNGAKVRKAAGAVLGKVKTGLVKQYKFLEGRYGRKQAIAIFAGGCVLGLATPLALVPGSTAIGAVPFMAVAETYRQAKRLFGKSVNEMSLEEIWDEAEKLLAHAGEMAKDGTEKRLFAILCKAKDASGHEHDNLGLFTGTGGAGAAKDKPAGNDPSAELREHLGKETQSDPVVASDRAGEWINDRYLELDNLSADAADTWNGILDNDEFNADEKISDIYAEHETFAQNATDHMDQAASDVLGTLKDEYEPQSDDFEDDEDYEQNLEDYEGDWESHAEDFTTATDQAKADFLKVLEKQRDLVEEYVWTYDDNTPEERAAALAHVDATQSRIDDAASKWVDDISRATQKLIEGVAGYYGNRKRLRGGINKRLRRLLTKRPH